MKPQKYMFISDVHGNTEMMQKCLEIFENEKADMLVLLGDTSAGFYNEDNNYYMAEMLNSLGKRVEVIRGNCDTSDFENKLDFEMYDDDMLFVNGKTISIEHGHRHNLYRLPQNCGDIFLQGHTHIPILVEQGGRILGNPGSVTRPRGGTDLRCYIIIDEKSIRLITLGGEVIKEINFVADH